MRRFVRLVPLALLVAALPSCGDAIPCTSCPPVDGVYRVSWGADGGTSTQDAGCTLGLPKADTWTLAQRGTNVTTTLDTLQLGGTLYDTYEMSLSGSSQGVNYRLRAFAIPQGAGADAGMKLQGTFSARELTESGALCEASEAFTAQRVSR